MYLNALCRAIFMSDLDSWDSVDAKNGLTHLDWTPDTRDTECVLKWVLARIAAFCCARRPQIWIPETEYYQKVSSHAQIGPQGAEKQLRKVNVGGGGGWVVGGGCKVQKPEQLSLHDEQRRAEQSARRSLSICRQPSRGTNKQKTLNQLRGVKYVNYSALCVPWETFIWIRF